jgi:phosphatidylserine decarboxylase
MTDEPVPDVSPDLPALHWRATLRLLGHLPQGALSRAFGRIADTHIPRRLRPGVRAWPAEEGIAGSPVDGVVGQSGRIRSGTLLQAKGRSYSALDLLADPDEAHRFDDGAFLTLYLSPRHYHRIHAPCGGAIARARHVPGALFPVNAPAVMHVDRLFPRNERLLCTIDGPLGRVAVVAVGAYNVGRISAAFDVAWNGGEHGWVTNRGTHAIEERRYDPPVRVERGEELMAFHLGSTVVLLFEPGVRLIPLAVGDPVRLGTPIAEAGGA